VARDHRAHNLMKAFPALFDRRDKPCAGSGSAESGTAFSVKSSSGLKDHYLDDIALQAFVLRGAGITVSSTELLHVNTAYVRGADGICWTDFFARMGKLQVDFYDIHKS
jgi:hypothetical protein